MGFDAKGLTEQVGMYRIAAIICLICGNMLQANGRCSAGTFSDYLWLFVFGEVLFLVLGCFGFGESEIMKLIDKIFHLASAVLVLFYIVCWLIDMVQKQAFGKLGGRIMCLIGIILQAVVGGLFAAITIEIWK